MDTPLRAGFAIVGWMPVAGTGLYLTHRAGAPEVPALDGCPLQALHTPDVLPPGPAVTQILVPPGSVVAMAAGTWGGVGLRPDAALGERAEAFRFDLLQPDTPIFSVDAAITMGWVHEGQKLVYQQEHDLWCSCGQVWGALRC